ncbi:hypothetical protein OG205_46245 [Lentzea sp. NBC_00516]|uniref:hypothetical protein n=1 Tax=Lentzea sp. NBC_00516 TaxID=2903582 RepID=UPI002E81AFEC|nr:hypothetical protein [Lentzea sp. NBC_00516]WUD25331.1 hypothetical protein OG205_46245 [Lentzea sp. NBC_00516]
MKIPTWAVLGICALAALTVIANAPMIDVCAQPGARCGTQPDWYTGEESVTTLRGVEMSANFDFLYDYSLLWVVAAAVLMWAVVRRSWAVFATAALFGLTVWLRPSYSAYLLIIAAAVAVLYEHRHRWLRRGQANG